MIKFRNFPYIVSEDGQIYREGRNKPLKADIDKKGYCRVTLCMGGKTSRFLVHRMVAECYHDNPNQYEEVLHKDNNPLNNHKDNVRWGTHSQNMVQCHQDNRCSNLLASEIAREKQLVKTKAKWKNILGTRYLGIENKTRLQIIFTCICGNRFSRRTDSPILKRGGICSECYQDEDIV